MGQRTFGWPSNRDAGWQVIERLWEGGFGLCRVHAPSISSYHNTYEAYNQQQLIDTDVP
jgi:hypothetical protein